MTSIKDAMSQRPVTVRPDDTLPEAVQAMKAHGIRRLPVVQGGRLIGIVTDRDLKEAMPSRATKLSIWEVSYLLGHIAVGEVMSTSVITADEDAPLQDAAHAMLRHKIGGLPVVNGRHDLVGVVTATDVLRDYVGQRRAAT